MSDVERLQRRITELEDEVWGLESDIDELRADFRKVDDWLDERPTLKGLSRTDGIMRMLEQAVELKRVAEAELAINKELRAEIAQLRLEVRS